jgi:hypothetical protein
VKKFFCVAFIALALCGMFAQTKIPPHQWNVTLKVVDENGNPVSGANTRVGYFVNSQPASFAGLTDTNGIFTASHSAASDLNELGFEANKSGFYTTRMECMLYPPYDSLKWNIIQTLTLKKIGNPTAMYAKHYTMGLKLPEYKKRIGYDLMVGDWVGPHGKGISSDIFFEKDYTNVSSREYYSKITVSFPKGGNGIQLYTNPDAGEESGLRSSHEAPTDGYQTELTRETSAHPGQPSKFEYDPNRIYLFRVRTALNDEGKVVSAHYGKIYGDFMQFSYYLNPTPNDRNIEFDPKQNLLGGLDAFEQVTAP